MSTSLLRKLLADQRLFWFASGRVRVKVFVLQIKVIREVAMVVREKDYWDTANKNLETSTSGLPRAVIR